MKKNKKLWIALIAVAAVIAILAGVYKVTRPATSQGSKTFTVEVTHKDGGVKTFTYHTDEEYVGKVLLDEGLITGEMGAYGLYIKSVDGEEAVYEVDASYWAVFVNGEYAAQGIDQTPANDGDKIGLTYTHG